MPALEEGDRRDVAQEDKGKRTKRGPCQECEKSEESGGSGPKRSIRFRDRIVGNFKNRHFVVVVVIVGVCFCHGSRGD